MTRKIFLNILLISIAISFLASISETIIFSYGSYRSSFEGMTSDEWNDEWKKIEDMHYREAISYLKAHSKKMSPLEVLMRDFSSFFMFFRYLEMSLRFFVPIFLTALFTTYRVLKLSRCASANTAQTADAKT